MKKVRIAIIGCGIMGQMHAKYAANISTIELSATCDVREQSAQTLAEKYNMPKVYVSTEEVFADQDIDAVIIAMPTGFREGLVVKAFKAGKHVLVEKPIAAHATQVDEMIQAQGDLVGACCSSRYSFPASAQVAHDLIATGVLGDLRVIHCRCMRPVGEPPSSTPPAWRVSRKLNGGGIMINWGCYDLDYLLGITDWSLKPQRVLAQTWHVADHLSDRVAEGSDGETHAVAFIYCQGGTVMTFERAESTSLPEQMAWQIVGSLGSLQLQMAAEGEAKVIHYDTSDSQGISEKVIWRGEIDHHLVHQAPIENFVNAILTGSPPKTSLQQARLIQQITDAIFVSSDEQKLVEINPLLAAC